MSDMGMMPDFDTLYSQLLEQYPRSKGKNASPQADLKAAVAWKKMIDSELGFDPQTYESPAKKQYSPKSSAVKLQYGNDPFISATLEDIDAGAETSATVAEKLLDPTTGEVKPELIGKVTQAQAQSALNAAQAYEKERAQNVTEQVDYENRQNTDPTFGRTPGSTGGKHILPEGDLHGMETPDITYSQAIQDMLNELSPQGEVQAPMPAYGAPARQVGQIATKDNPLGGRAVDTSIRGLAPPPVPTQGPQPSGGAFGFSPYQSAEVTGRQLPQDPHRDMTPVMSRATGVYADKGNFLEKLAQVQRRLTPRVGPSAQERAGRGIAAMQEYGNKYAKPVRSQANQAAVQKLLNIIALQGQ